MHSVTTVIVTDKLDQVRDFYQTHFVQLPNGSYTASTFSLRPNSEAFVMWQAAQGGEALTQGVTVRIHTPFPEIERATHLGKGLACSDLQEEDWGEFHGNTRWFSIMDPSGTRIVFYQDHIGEIHQLMTTGDGRETREVQKG